VANNENFVDDIIEYIQDDVEKIQRKPGMYISDIGSEGAEHLVKEIINNAIDECINVNSPGKNIDIFLDENDNSIMVRDDGRGIKEDSIEIACSKIQSGSKFDREGTGATGGENGVGLCCCTALSELLEVVVYRNGRKYTLIYKDGKKMTDIESTPCGKNKHGTSIKMIPSKFFLGDDCDIHISNIQTWIEKISYLLPKDISIRLDTRRKGRDLINTKKYKNVNGLLDYIKTLTKKPLIDPIHFLNGSKMKEFSRGKYYDRFIGLEVAFTYDNSLNEAMTDSFCNFINTIDGGVHEDAVKKAIINYIMKKHKDIETKKETKKPIELIPLDITQGLLLTLYVNTTYQPQFASQTKHKMNNKNLFYPIRDLATKSIDEYFNEHPKELQKLIDRVKLNAKIRLEADKVKENTIKNDMTSYDEQLLSNFVPANNIGKNQYRELFIIEGDSAKGSAKIGRYDNDTQALFSAFGVPKNVYDVPMNKMLENATFKSLINHLGCNVGSKFNIDNLKYNKIIIMTDSDSDGFNITSLYCAFFLAHLRPIVENGFLYKAIAPLYEIKSKLKKFVSTKKQFIQIFEQQIGSSIIISDNNHKYSSKELQDFLYRNRDYLEELIRVSNHLAINKNLLEFTLYHSDDKDFITHLKKIYPEISIENNNGVDILSGIVDNKYQILIMDNVYKKNISKIKSMIDENRNYSLYYNVFERYDNEYIDKGKMTIGEFLSMIQKFQPIIVKRFKGLGELEPSELRNTTMDPNNRILIRLTIEDIERDLNKFDILHSKKVTAKEARRLMMSKCKISREELDN
jgi:DNA gyrase subunit B